MRWLAIVLAAVLVLAAGMGSAQTPSSAPPVKLALVIGNADYDGGGIDVTPQGIAQSTAGGYVPDLRNPINDANDVGDALKRIGFSVTTVLNGDGPTMSAALATFGTKVAEAPDTAQVVIYYAGHAMQVDGVNYLIPARARLPQVDFSRMPSRQGYSVIESVTVPIQRVVDQFREPRAPGVNLLILDACRDNPWDSRVRGLTRNTSPNAGGLAQVAAPTRTIVSFSTALNRKAQDGGERDRNSPFAAALKDAIGKPGTIAEMLDGVGTVVEAVTFGRQSPWYQSASVGQACLFSCTTNAASPAIPTGPSVPPQEVLILNNYIYCTRSFGAMGLEYNPQLPTRLDVVLVTGGPDGRLGDGCLNTGQTGRLKIAEIPMSPGGASGPFDVTVQFRVKVEGGCTLSRTSRQGFATFRITLRVQPGQYSTTYVEKVLDQQGREIASVSAAEAAITQIPCIPYADLNGKAREGVFALCQRPSMPRYTVHAISPATVDVVAD